MIVESNNKPLEVLVLNLANGLSEVSIAQNAEEITIKREEEEEDLAGWRYDLHQVKVITKEGLQEDVEANIDKYVEMAEQAAAASTKIPPTQSEINAAAIDDLVTSLSDLGVL